MSVPNEVTIGVDLGTSGVRVLALDASGVVVARARRPVTTHRPAIGAAEQSTDDWWAALDSAIRALSRDVPPSQWSAIGLSGMIPTLVVHDNRSRVSHAAITWEDARAHDDGARFRDGVGSDRLYEITGQRVDGRYLVPMANRLKRLGMLPSRPMLLSAKDHLFHRMTGATLTDPSTACGFGVFDLTAGGWDPHLVAEAGHPQLPTVAPADQTRPLLPILCQKWGIPEPIPVALGAADSLLAMLALEVAEKNGIAYVAGTSTAILTHAATARLDPGARYIVSPDLSGGYALEMDLLSTGSTFSWAARLLGVEGPAELIRMAWAAPVGSEPTVLPYLTPGEQGALWDDTLTGTITGMTLSTTREAVARAFERAVIGESMRCIDVLESADGNRTGGIVVTGSSGASETFRQDLADATGHTVSYIAGESDHSAIGAAMIAARAQGLAVTPRTEQPQIAEPTPGKSAVWRQALAHMDELRAKLFPTRPQAISDTSSRKPQHRKRTTTTLTTTSARMPE